MCAKSSILAGVGKVNLLSPTKMSETGPPPPRSDRKIPISERFAFDWKFFFSSTSPLYTTYNILLPASGRYLSATHFCPKSRARTNCAIGSLVPAPQKNFSLRLQNSHSQSFRFPSFSQNLDTSRYWVRGALSLVCVVRLQSILLRYTPCSLWTSSCLQPAAGCCSLPDAISC